MRELEQFTQNNLSVNTRRNSRLLVIDETSIRCNSLPELKAILSASDKNVILGIPDHQYIKGKRGWAKAHILASVSPNVTGVIPLTYDDARNEMESGWGETEVSGTVYWSQTQTLTVEKPIESPVDFEQTNSDLDIQLMRQAKEMIAGSNCWLDPAGVVIARGETVLATGVSTTYSHVDCPAIPIKFSEVPLDPGERMLFCGSLHAERVGIASAAKKGISLAGATIYVSKFPCNPCATDIIAAGIGTVIFEKDSYGIAESVDLLAGNHIEMKRVVI